MRYGALTHVGKKTGMMRSSVNKNESDTNVMLTP